MGKKTIFFVSILTLVCSESALADTAPSIPKFLEVAPQYQCASGEGAPARAAGTIFRGGHPDADGLKMLASTYFVKSIDNLEDGTIPATEVQLIASLGLTIRELLHPLPQVGVIQLPNGGGDDNEAMIAAVSELRRPSNFPIFVHCTHGEDRTGMVVALHRVFNECWSAQSAEAEWDSIQETGGDILQKAMHDYFKNVTGNADLSAEYRTQLSQLQ